MEAVQGPKKYPDGVFGGMLEYIPELGGSVRHANNWQMHGTCSTTSTRMPGRI